jgi:hypothetical protein
VPRLVALIVAFLALAILFPTDQSLGSFGVTDLLEYWGAATLFVRGENPYDPIPLRALQAEIIPGLDRPIMMYNPPLSLPLLTPLTLVDFSVLVPLWTLVSVMCGVTGGSLALHHFARRLDYKPGRRLVPLVFFVTFYPTVATLAYGQISLILLLFLGAFLALYVRNGRLHDSAIAGALLAGTLIKPHLLYLVYLFVGLHAYRVKRYRTVVGFLAGGATLSVLALIISPDIWSWYRETLNLAPPIYFRTPTLGSWLQAFTGMHSLSVRVLPTLLMGSFVIMLFMLASNRAYVPYSIYLLIPLSLVSSPYGWVYDQVLLVPSLGWIWWRAFRSLDNGSAKPIGYSGSILFQAQLFYYIIPGSYGQDVYVWYPLVIALLMLWLRRTKHGTRPTVSLETESPVAS